MQIDNHRPFITQLRFWHQNQLMKNNQKYVKYALRLLVTNALSYKNKG